MKNGLAKYLLLALLVASCRSGYQGDIVKETYIHKYGVPVSHDDWMKQGQTGKIVQQTKDGTTVTRSFADGVLNGESTYTYPNTSTLARTETYEKGVLVAKKTNYPSGTPYSEEDFERELISKRMLWYEDGTPQVVESYTDGLLVSGEYRSPVNGIESRVKNGEGTRVLRDAEGVLLAKESIEGGYLVERVDYFPNGDPRSITPFYNNHIQGTRLTFAQGGLPRTVEQWEHGQQHGITMEYLNGEKVSEVPYVHGRREGIERRFRDGTILVEEVTWREGHQHGPRTIFVDGASQIDYFHQGQLVSRPTFERLNPPRLSAS